MKKLFALLLALIMVLSLAACQPSTPTDSSSQEDVKPTVTDPDDKPDTPVVEPEALPESPLLYWDFESTDGLTAVEKYTDADSIVSLVASEHQILTADGVVGKALYLDGKYGVKLDMNDLDIADDSYTVSFWIYAERLGDYMPIVQLGRNINSADESLPTAWLNFTRGGWAETYPLAWSRNSSIPWATDENGVWPWIAGPADEVYGKGEWCLVTLVVDGNRYTCLDDNGDRIGTRYYLNGELVFDASAENLYYQGVAPELFTGSPVDGYIGINYWDALYKGYIDELTIYDEALTSGQVLSLYQKGDTTVVPEAPVEGGGVEEEPPIVLPEITVDTNALSAVGAVTRDNGFWTSTSNGYELQDGYTLTLKLNNYSGAGNNWSNYVVALANTAVTADKLANADNYEGYAEYAVFRADSYGWGADNFVWTTNWTDWTAWLELMKDAEVTVALTRNGATVKVETTFVGADGTTMTSAAVITTSLTAESPCYVFVTSENAYVELLSVN